MQSYRYDKYLKKNPFLCSLTSFEEYSKSCTESPRDSNSAVSKTGLIVRRVGESRIKLLKVYVKKSDSRSRILEAITEACVKKNMFSGNPIYL